jgi:hypothetical protein
VVSVPAVRLKRNYALLPKSNLKHFRVKKWWKRFFIPPQTLIFVLSNQPTHTMKRELNLAQQIVHFKTEGVFPANDGMTKFHGFFDWFCSDHALEAKSKKLANQVIKFLKVNPQIDPEKNYVFFKNNCPMVGPLYDSFSICDMESGEVQYWVTGKSGHTLEAEVYSREAGFNTPIATGKNFTDMLNKLK